MDVITGSFSLNHGQTMAATAGYIEYVPGMLIVEQNAQGQAQVAQMLKQLDGK